MNFVFLNKKIGVVVWIIFFVGPWVYLIYNSLVVFEDGCYDSSFIKAWILLLLLLLFFID